MHKQTKLLLLLSLMVMLPVLGSEHQEKLKKRFLALGEMLRLLALGETLLMAAVKVADFSAVQKLVWGGRGC